MKRLVGVALIMTLMGCDVAVLLGVGLKKKKSTGSDSVSQTPPPPDATYHVWVANLTGAAPYTVSDQQNDLSTNGGNPNVTVWTHLGTGTATATFASASTYNAVLVQAGDAQVFEIETVEIVDTQGNTIEVVGSVAGSGNVTSPGNVIGYPDTLTATTAADSTHQAYLFFVCSATTNPIRVSAWSALPGTGDLLSVQTWLPGAVSNQSPGGATLGPGGNVFVTVSDGPVTHAVEMVEFDPAAVAAPAIRSTEIGATSQAAGAHGVAFDATNGFFYLATTIDAATGRGNIQVRKLNTSFVQQLSVFIGTSSGLSAISSLVEANSVAIDSTASPVVAGGAPQLLFPTVLNNSTWRLNPANLAAMAGWPQTTADNANACHWGGVATLSGGGIFTTGDQFATSTNVIFSRKSDLAAAVQWSDFRGDSQVPNDFGRAIAVNASNVTLVGGYFGATGPVRNSAIIRFDPLGLPFSVISINGPSGGDDEVLSVAIEADGTFYVGGYIGISGALGQDLWIRKYDTVGNVVWTRTYHGGLVGGNDRAVQILISGTDLIVVGRVTNPSSNQKVHVRRYVK